MIFAADMPPPPPLIEHILVVDEIEQLASLETLICLARWEYQNYHSHDDVEEKAIFLQHVTQQVLTIMPEYSTGNLQSNVANFAKDTLNVDEQPIVNLLSRDNAHHRDIVYFISTGSKSDIELVIKTYPAPSQSFFDEINGIKMHQELALENSTVVQIMNIAASQMEEGALLMVAHSVAPGEKVANFMTSAANGAPAIYRLGEALGELHAKGEPSSRGIDQFMREFNSNYEKALKTMDDYLLSGEDEELKALYAGVDREHLQTHIADTNKCLPSKIPTGYVHGDAHLKNFLYDTPSNTLSMIDLGGLALGIPGRDYYTIMEHIGALKLDTNERESLKQDFLQGYAAAGGNIPPPELLDLLSLNNQLVVLGTHAWFDAYPPDLRKLVKAIIKRNIDNLKQSW